MRLFASSASRVSHIRRRPSRPPARWPAGERQRAESDPRAGISTLTRAAALGRDHCALEHDPRPSDPAPERPGFYGG